MTPGFTEASSLLFRTSLHFLFLVLPCLAICVFALRRGVRSSVLLAGIGLASTALNGYAVFSLWFLSYRLVRPLDCLVQAAALFYVTLSFKSLSAIQRAVLRPLISPALLVFTSSLLILASAFAYGGLDQPLETAQTRFSHALPADNTLPLILAEQMMGSHKIAHPFSGDWLASDRPPLQTAILLSQYPAVVAPRAISYQVLASLEQSLWIFGLWLLLYSLNINRKAIALVLAGSLSTSLVFVNTLFVWPKLLAAGYFLGCAGLLLSRQLLVANRHQFLAGIVAGALCAWSFLSHGGTLFAFLALVPIMILLWKRVTWKAASLLLAVAAILYLPWSFYQKLIDPPGDRLLKWHFAGVIPIDSRPFSTALLDSYTALSNDQILANKSANFALVFHRNDFLRSLPAFFLRPATVPATPEYRRGVARQLNAVQFFYFEPNLGFYILGLPLLLLALLPQFRSTESKAAALFWSMAGIANIIWCCLMFGPATTIVHQGSYAVELLAFAGAILCLWSISQWCAAFVVALQICFFFSLEFIVLKPAGTLRFSTAALAVVALIATAFFLYRVGESGSHVPDN